MWCATHSYRWSLLPTHSGYMQPNLDGNHGYPDDYGKLLTVTIGQAVIDPQV